MSSVNVIIWYNKREYWEMRKGRDNDIVILILLLLQPKNLLAFKIFT